MMAMRGGGGSKVEVGDSRGASGKSGEEPWLVDKASWDSTDDTDAEPQARTVSAPPDESAAEPTLQESLETRRDQLLAWLSLS